MAKWDLTVYHPKELVDQLKALSNCTYWSIGVVECVNFLKPGNGQSRWVPQLGHACIQASISTALNMQQGQALPVVGNDLSVLAQLKTMP